MRLGCGLEVGVLVRVCDFEGERGGEGEIVYMDALD